MNCNCYQYLSIKLKEKTGDPFAEIETAMIKKGNKLELKPVINSKFREKKRDGTFNKKETILPIIANYCPFCGTNVETKAETPETSNKPEAEK